MKLIANNFTGQLPTGEGYKINVNYNGETGFLQGILYVERIGVFWVEYIESALVAENYKTYKEALYEVLVKLEERYNLQLIKLNIAV